MDEKNLVKDLAQKVLHVASIFIPAKFAGTMLFGRFLSWLPVGSGLSGKTWIVLAVLGLSVAALIGLASWTNKYYNYGHKGLSIYKALFGGLPSGKAYGIYLALSALSGGLWGALGASALALFSHV